MRWLLVLRPWRICASSIEIRRSRVTPRRIRATPCSSVPTSWSRTCLAAASPAATCGSPPPPSSAANPSTRPTAPSTTPSACPSAAGSSQSRSNAAFKLDAANSGVPARSASTRVPSASPHPCWRANTPTTLRSAWPNKLIVSSTLPAPHNGLESSAARSLPPGDPTGKLPIQPHRALHQPPIQLMGDQPSAKHPKRRLRKRRLGVVHAVQHQLPAPIHHTGFDHLIIASAGVGLQDRRQAKLRRRYRRLPHRGVLVHAGQLGLEVGVEQLVAVLTQPHEQLGAHETGRTGDHAWVSI